MGVSKVIYGNSTLIDISGDTVTANSLLKNVTAHKADGTPITGNAGAYVDGTTLYIPGTQGTVVNGVLTLT